MKSSDWARKAKGRAGENLAAFSEILQGRILTPTGVGSDFWSEPNPAIPPDPITGEMPEEGYYLEVKTGGSGLTPRQKQTKDENSGHYKVRRPPI